MNNKTDLFKYLIDYKEGKIAVPGTYGGNDLVHDPKITQHPVVAMDYMPYGLRELIKNNDGWLKVLYGVLIGIIILLSVILWLKQDNKAFFFSILGGQSAGIIFFINRLSYFYDQKRTSEWLLYLYENAPTQEEKEKILEKITNYLIAKRRQ